MIAEKFPHFLGAQNTNTVHSPTAALITLNFLCNPVLLNIKIPKIFICEEKKAVKIYLFLIHKTYFIFHFYSDLASKKSSRGSLVVERLLHKKSHCATVDQISLEASCVDSL